MSCSRKVVRNLSQYVGKPLDQFDVIAKIGSFSSSPPLFIKDVRIDSNYLFCTVEYEGSCSKDETFECVGLEKMNENGYPPIRYVKIQYRAIIDDCKELKTRTLTINIRELAYEKLRNTETDLQINGWRSTIRYVFPP